MYAKKKAKERNNNLLDLENRLKTLIILNDENEGNETIENEKQLIESKIENIYNFKAPQSSNNSNILIFL